MSVNSTTTCRVRHWAKIGCPQVNNKNQQILTSDTQWNTWQNFPITCEQITWFLKCSLFSIIITFLSWLKAFTWKRPNLNWFVLTWLITDICKLCIKWNCAGSKLVLKWSSLKRQSIFGEKPCMDLRSFEFMQCIINKSYGLLNVVIKRVLHYTREL